MKVAVVIPVGPGHDQISARAAASVRHAWAHDPGPFSHCTVKLVHDLDGLLGRSAARNRGMDESPADWHFLLDADDEMDALAFTLVDLKEAATFGAISLTQKGERKVIGRNVSQCTRETLFLRGADGTLAMGCFVRGDLGLRFDESLDAAEDFDFYLRLPSFTKRSQPLVHIGYEHPSAGGPRGYEALDWRAACEAVIRRHMEVRA